VETMKKKLYVCLTYYHTLITLIKSLISGEEYNLYLSNNIPGYEDLRARLENTNRFEIIEYPGRILKQSVKKHPTKVGQVLFYKRDIKRLIERYCTLDLRKYEVFLYHDMSFLGIYCVHEGIEYHLLEDALDYFKYFDKYYNVKKGSFENSTLQFYLKEKLGIGSRIWGMSPYCIDIEVNDKNGIKIHSDKVIEVPRKELFGSMSPEQKMIVYNTFASDKNVDITHEKSALLCTQPLFTDKHVSSLEEQILVFEMIVKEYTDQGFHMVIKPHPRDQADYQGIIRKYHCGLIDKNLPSEILNYNPEARFKTAISVTSTAINFLECADEKKFMGMDFVKEVLVNHEKTK